MEKTDYKVRITNKILLNVSILQHNLTSGEHGLILWKLDLTSETGEEAKKRYHKAFKEYKNYLKELK